MPTEYQEQGFSFCTCDKCLSNIKKQLADGVIFVYDSLQMHTGHYSQVVVIAKIISTVVLAKKSIRTWKFTNSARRQILAHIGRVAKHH